MKKFFYTLFFIHYFISGQYSRGALPINTVKGEFRSKITPLYFEESGVIITKSGSYVLANDFMSKPTKNKSLIFIASDNVHLDLNASNLYIPDDTNTNIIIDGVTIAENLSNIVIKNGNINNITGTAIKVGKNCFNIRLNDLTLTKANQGGIVFDTGIQACFISNCFIGSCNSIDTNAVGIKIDTGQDITISSCSFLSNKAVSGYDSYGITLNNSINCSFTNVESNNNQGDSVVGIYIKNSTNCSFNNCEANYNRATVGSSCGFKLENTTATTLFECSTLSNKGFTNAAGIHLLGSSMCNQFKKCIMTCQESSGRGNAYGLLSLNGVRNSFNDCESFGNKGGNSTNSIGAGMFLDSEENSSIVKCKCNYNNGNNGIGYGLYLTHSNYCVIKNNSFLQNTGSEGSWGLYEVDNSTSYIVRNEAFGNAINYYVPLSFGEFKYKSREISDTDELPNKNANDNLSINLISKREK